MSVLVGNPEDRFSHNEAQISPNTHLICSSTFNFDLAPVTLKHKSNVNSQVLQTKNALKGESTWNKKRINMEIKENITR